jgi:hypothetical protein
MDPAQRRYAPRPLSSLSDLGWILSLTLTPLQIHDDGSSATSSGCGDAVCCCDGLPLSSANVDPVRRRPATHGSGDDGVLRPCVLHSGSDGGARSRNGLAGGLRNGLTCGLMDFFVFLNN